jgi:hypothetical protein
MGISRARLRRLEKLAAALPPPAAAYEDTNAFWDRVYGLVPLDDLTAQLAAADRQREASGWAGPEWKFEPDQAQLRRDLPADLWRRYDAAAHLVRALSPGDAEALLKAHDRAAWDWKCYRGRYADRLHPLPRPDPVTGYDCGPFHPPAAVHPDAWPGPLPLADLQIDGDLRRRTAEALAEFRYLFTGRV